MADVSLFVSLPSFYPHKYIPQIAGNTRPNVLRRRPLCRADGMFYGHHEAPFSSGFTVLRSRESPSSIDADLIIARLGDHHL